MTTWHDAPQHKTNPRTRATSPRIEHKSTSSPSPSPLSLLSALCLFPHGTSPPPPPEKPRLLRHGSTLAPLPFDSTRIHPRSRFHSTRHYLARRPLLRFLSIL